MNRLHELNEEEKGDRYVTCKPLVNGEIHVIKVNKEDKVSIIMTHINEKEHKYRKLTLKTSKGNTLKQNSKTQK